MPKINICISTFDSYPFVNVKIHINVNLRGIFFNLIKLLYKVKNYNISVTEETTKPLLFLFKLSSILP